MGEILAYYEKYYRIFLDADFIMRKCLTIKTWISSYSPIQEKLENLCFVTVDLRIHKPKGDWFHCIIGYKTKDKGLVLPFEPSVKVKHWL